MGGRVINLFTGLSVPRKSINIAVFCLRGRLKQNRGRRSGDQASMRTTQTMYANRWLKYSAPKWSLRPFRYWARKYAGRSTKRRRAIVTFVRYESEDAKI